MKMKFLISSTLTFLYLKIKKSPKETKKWTVLQDDFMLQTKMKDWDKDDDDDQNRFDGD